MGMRHRKISCRYERPAVFTIDPHIAGFGRHVQLLQAWIEGKNVGIISDRVSTESLHVGQVNQGQRVIASASDKRQPIRDIKCNAVGFIYTGNRIAANDLELDRIDYSQFVLLMNRHQNMFGRRIINRVTSSTSQRDLLNQTKVLRINDGIRISMLIRYKDPLWTWCVCKAIGVIDGPLLCN